MRPGLAETNSPSSWTCASKYFLVSGCVSAQWIFEQALERTKQVHVRTRRRITVVRTTSFRFWCPQVKTSTHPANLAVSIWKPSPRLSPFYGWSKYRSGSYVMERSIKVICGQVATDISEKHPSPIMGNFSLEFFFLIFHVRAKALAHCFIVVTTQGVPWKIAADIWLSQDMYTRHRLFPPKHSEAVKPVCSATDHVPFRSQCQKTSDLLNYEKANHHLPLAGQERSDSPQTSKVNGWAGI